MKLRAVSQLSHIPPISPFPLFAPVVQTTPHGLTLPPAFCRMPGGIVWFPFCVRNIYPA